ncbi:MAG: hypothetical protein KDD33_07195 [Bdellovibrionales bacterium]|nr:hypothetical protein [Bdellovibrionales bacterium]
MAKKRLAVFISGNGTNLNVILERKTELQSLLVICNNPRAYGIERAKEHGVPFWVLEKPIPWDSLHERLEKENLDGIFLAGFMKVIPAEFVKKWQGKMFNLHPSLLPHYKGLNSIERAFEDGADIGVSIHYVTAEVDAGEVLLQDIAVPSHQIPTMSLEEATTKTHECEHRLVGKWMDQWL